MNYSIDSLFLLSIINICIKNINFNLTYNFLLSAYSSFIIVVFMLETIFVVYEIYYYLSK